MLHKRIAYTLAEVLITLGIIGVVAEMTIPTLMNNIQDAELKTAWKKSFSIISQSTMTMLNDNSGSLTGVFTSSDNMKDVYKNYLIHSKDCNSAENCVYNFHYLDGHEETTPNETSLFLNDGSIWEFGYVDINCVAINGTSAIPACGTITVDVNGAKKPNIVGRDIFIAIIQANKVVPGGAQGQKGAYIGCDSSLSGWGCSAKVLYN